MRNAECGKCVGFVDQSFAIPHSPFPIRRRERDRAFRVSSGYNLREFGGVAVVAELADAQDLGSCVRKDVEVRVLSAAIKQVRLVAHLRPYRRWGHHFRFPILNLHPRSYVASSFR